MVGVRIAEGKRNLVIAAIFDSPVRFVMAGINGSYVQKEIMSPIT